MNIHFPITDPTQIFFIVLCVILFAPIIMGKLRIPHIIGLVLFGVLLGEYGLNILVRDSSFEIFGKVGLYYIMFIAALELDIEGAKKHKNKFFTFGLLTFAIPFIITFVASQTLLGYGVSSSLLLSCIMSSNTLIAYPIVTRYGLQQNVVVKLTVGATMIALMLSLIILAIVTSIVKETSGVLFWIFFVLKFLGVCVILIYSIPRVTRFFLRKYSDAVMQFIFVMAILFISAMAMEIIDIDGILGSFLAGIIINRYIPKVSPLMNRIEFIGNAIFIPYFLIGVGMIINVRVLVEQENILFTIVCITLFGTIGKAIGAYLTQRIMNFNRISGNMMFGLTSAHAAGAIAIVMIGLKIPIGDGQFLVDDKMVNGVMVMILVTCVISTIITEKASKQIVINDEIHTDRTSIDKDDEIILLPVKYPETSDNLLDLALSIRNQKLNRGLVAINVVYDDKQRVINQEKGRLLLEHLQKLSSASEVLLQTQVRISTNIANGIKHAFQEFNASELVIGMPVKWPVLTKFWSNFALNLSRGINRQVIYANINQPLNTVRNISVAVPSRAQFEHGFLRWVERLARLSQNLDCRIQFNARQDTLQFIEKYISNNHQYIRSEYLVMEHWNELPEMITSVKHDHLLVIVSARQGTVSYKTALEKLPKEIQQYYKGSNLLIIFPDQYVVNTEEMTFSEPQHHEDISAYSAISDWIMNKNKLFRNND